MKARDVMVCPVVTVKPSTSVKELANILLQNRISGVPVVDEHNKLVGIVSEGDLMHRVEIGTERRRSWWLHGFTGMKILTDEYVKAHACKVADIMTTRVIIAAPDTPLYEIAGLLERNLVKRVPIVKDGELVGIVSRANLVQAIATSRQDLRITPSDGYIRDRLLTHLQQQDWSHPARLSVMVSGGIVDLWGVASSVAEKTAIRVAAESSPGVSGVNDHVIVA